MTTSSFCSAGHALPVIIYLYGHCELSTIYEYIEQNISLEACVIYMARTNIYDL